MPRLRAGGRVASRLRAEAGQADLPRTPAGAGLRWVALRRRWPQPAPLICGARKFAANFSNNRAVSYTMRYFHTAPRSCPSDAIQTQPAARSNRSKRLAAAEKRLDYCWPHHEVIARLASPTSAVAFLSRGFGPEISHLYSPKVQLLKALLEPGFAPSRPETAEPLVPQGHARTH